jgi:hypothetical protein
MNEEKKIKPAEMIISQTIIEMPGTEYERRSYYTTLKDNEKETRFIFRLSADGMMVAEPYVEHEYDYDHHYDEEDEDDDEDDDSYYDDEDEDEEEFDDDEI